MYRTGEVVFAQLSYEWKIKRQLLKGSAPARLLRFFMWDDEEDASQGEKRLMVEQAWLWNHDTIMTVPGAEEVIPASIIHMLREDPKKYLQGDLMTCEDFETMLSDATCYRHSEEWAMPEADVHAFIIVGAVEFDISQEDGTVVNRGGVQDALGVHAGRRAGHDHQARRRAAVRRERPHVPCARGTARRRPRAAAPR